MKISYNQKTYTCILYTLYIMYRITIKNNYGSGRLLLRKGLVTIVLSTMFNVGLMIVDDV